MPNIKNRLITYLYKMGKAVKKKPKTPKTMEELTKGFEEFMKGKEVNPNGKEHFEKALKKVIKKKGS